MANLRNFLLPGLAVITVYLLSRGAGNGTTEAVAGSVLPKQDFDYYITDMSNTRFDATGKPDYKLNATRATHYPDTNTAEMNDPHFLYFKTEASPWEATAATGIFSVDAARNEDRLELHDDVVVRREMNDGSFLVASTEKLDVFPDSEEIYTEVPVTLEASGSHLQSTGMRAFFNEEKIELETAVKGFHE